MARWLIFVAFAMLSVVSCVPPTQAAGHPARQSLPLLQPAGDYAVPGRLLAVKDGSIYQFARGTFGRLAGGERFDGPAFSPDGRRIAASIVGENHSDLVLLDQSGKRLVQLTDHWSKLRVADSAWARHPAWSPDGQRLAFASDFRGSELALWTIDVSSRALHQIMAAPGLGGVDWPTWSPNGRELALTFFEANASQLALVSATAGPIKNLTQNREGAYDPSWSPDGSRIAYVARESGRSDIWLMDDDGANPNRLTGFGAARSPTWSPDGSLVAFLGDQGQGFDLYVLKLPLPDARVVSPFEIKRLTSGQNLDAPAGLSWDSR